MKKTMTNSEIARMLDHFVRGEIEPWEFDDFISSPQAGEVEPLRLELARLSEIYPPTTEGGYCSDEGLDRISQIAEEIRSWERGASAGPDPATQQNGNTAR